MLVVQHQADCPPALLGLWLDAAGCALDVRHPYAGEPLPSGLGEHDALLLLGGSMGAYDDAAHSWLTTTKELVLVAADRGVPTLGICLGHQLAAVALGGTVEVNPHGRQLGVLPMGWTDDASDDPLVSARPDRVIHWNNDVVADLPPGATALAHAPDGTVQAARLAPEVWGLQPHPEVDDTVVARWAADEREEIGPAVLDAALAEMRSAVPDLARAWQQVATAFAQRVRVTSKA